MNSSYRIPLKRLGAAAAAVLTLVLAAASARPAAAEDAAAVTFSVDASLGGQKAGVESVAGPDGARGEFVAGQLIVATSDAAVLKGFQVRWGAQVIDSFDGKELGLPAQHLLRIDTTRADPTALATDLARLKAPGAGPHRFSSDAGMRLAAAAVHEAANGLSVGLNWIPSSQTIRARRTTEAPGAVFVPYTPDAYAWAALGSGTAQNTRVGEAWNLLARAVLDFSRSVPVTVLDGGFGNDPRDVAVASRDSALPNTLLCGGTPCPWHGTSVSSVLASRIDDAFGGAGVAGSVASTTQVTITDMFSTSSALLRARLAGERIVNMSFGGTIPALFAPTTTAFSQLAFAVRGAGTLLYAAAGNGDAMGNGLDVDRQHCALVCWEATYFWPCETPGIDCVGALGAATAAPAGYSNFSGADADGGTVDVWAPGTVVVGPDPGLPGNVAQMFTGTSAATPFVSGVAALVWAARRSLGSDAVGAIVLETARPGTGRVTRSIDAQAAVERALGDLPPDVTIAAPVDGRTVNQGAVLRLTAIASDRESTPRVDWVRGGAILTSGADVTVSTSGWPVGTYTLSARAVDSLGRGVSAPADVRVTIAPPWACTPPLC